MKIIIPKTPKPQNPFDYDELRGIKESERMKHLLATSEQHRIFEIPQVACREGVVD